MLLIANFESDRWNSQKHEIIQLFSSILNYRKFNIILSVTDILYLKKSHYANQTYNKKQRCKSRMMCVYPSRVLRE